MTHEPPETTMKDNLPPGVTENMIPGNTPEDRREEAFWDEVDTFITANDLDLNRAGDQLDNLESPLCRLLIHVHDLAFSAGYTEGDSDASMAQSEILDATREELYHMKDVLRDLLGEHPRHPDQEGMLP